MNKYIMLILTFAVISGVSTILYNFLPLSVKAESYKLEEKAYIEISINRYLKTIYIYNLSINFREFLKNETYLEIENTTVKVLLSDEKLMWDDVFSNRFPDIPIREYNISPNSTINISINKMLYFNEFYVYLIFENMSNDTMWDFARLGVKVSYDRNYKSYLCPFLLFFAVLTFSYLLIKVIP